MGSLRVRHDWVTSFSRSGEGNGNPLQYSCLENPRDRGAWWAAVYGVAQSRIWLKRLSSSSSIMSSANSESFTSHSICCCSVEFDSLQPHGLQHTRLYCVLSFTVSQSLLKLMSIESMMPRNHLILCCPLLLLPSIIPSIRVFSNQLGLPPCGHSIGVSVSASVLPMNIQGWFSLELTGLFFLFSKGLSRVFSRTIVQKHPFFGTQFLYGSTLTSILIDVTNGKTIALTIQTFAGKVVSLLLNSQSRFVITFLPRSKCLLISWLQSLSSVILDLKKIKSVTVSIFFPSTCHELMGPNADPSFLDIEF